MKKKENIVLAVIVSISFFLRIYQISTLPSFQEDEAALAYNSYSILKTGKDLTGQFLPISTASLGDARPAFYVYLILLPMKIFGVNEFSARLPSIIFSVLTILLMYFFVNDFFKNKAIGLISSFLLTFSFWHITLSREASEKVTSLFFVLLGIFLLLRYLRQDKNHILILILSFFSFLISIDSYYSPRIFLLLFLPCLIIIFKDKIKSIQIKYFALFLVGFSILNIYLSFFGVNSERANQLSIFNNPETIAILNEQISEDGHNENTLITRFFHNKAVGYSFTLMRNFLYHLSPDFYLVSGGESPRYQVPLIGLMNFAETPFLLIGIYYLIDSILKKGKKELIILFIWFFISIIPSALAFHEVPSSYRIITIIPPFIVFIAFGIYEFFNNLTVKKYKKIVLLIFITLYGWHLTFFLHQYFLHFEVHKPMYRNYAQKELALFLKQKANDYQKVYVTQVGLGTNHVIPFFLKYDPQIYQKNWDQGKNLQNLGNIAFIDAPCVYPILLSQNQIKESGKYLFVNQSECENESKSQFKVINWKDGFPAYRLIEKEILLKEN